MTPDELLSRHGWKLARAMALAKGSKRLRRELHGALREAEQHTGLHLACLWDDDMCFCGEPWWLRNVFIALQYKKLLG